MIKEFETVEELLKYAFDHNIKNYSAKNIRCPDQLFGVWTMEFNEND